MGNVDDNANLVPGQEYTAIFQGTGFTLSAPQPTDISAAVINDTSLPISLITSAINITAGDLSGSANFAVTYVYEGDGTDTAIEIGQSMANDISASFTLGGATYAGTNSGTSSLSGSTTTVNAAGSVTDLLSQLGSGATTLLYVLIAIIIIVGIFYVYKETK